MAPNPLPLLFALFAVPLSVFAEEPKLQFCGIPFRRTVNTRLDGRPPTRIRPLILTRTLPTILARCRLG